MKYSLVIIALLGLLSCKNSTEKQDDTNNTIETEIENQAETFVKAISFPSSSKSQTPYLVATNDNLYLSWQETENDTVFNFRYSKLTEDTFSAPETIMTGDNWFVNWADYPVITENKGNMLAHVLQKSAIGTYTYDVKLSLKTKNGNNWSKPFKLHQDTTKSEHGFVSMIPFKDGFFATWLDGRNTVNVSEDNRAMNLRGAFIDGNGAITNDKLLDDKICDCCQTTAAITSNGPVVIYRDRSDAEVRDMSIVRYFDGKWTTPKTIYQDNWKIEGCPVNGPRVAALGDQLAVAWFTTPNEYSTVNVSFSSDAGETFQKPTKVDLGNPLGRVDIVLIDDNNAVVSWLEDDKILARKVNVNDEMGKILTISSTSKSRASGFPQMELLDSKLYFAWTMVDENKKTSIKLGKLSVSDFK